MGNMGLLKGVNNFDPERGLRFSTYATWWIRQGISRQRQDSEYQIRLPVQMHWRMSDVDKARKRLEVKGERVTIRSLATEAGLNPRQVKEILVYRANLMHPVGLDISSSGDDEKSSLAELVEDEQDTPEEQLVDTQKREIVEALIGELPEREALILRRRFGFYDGRSWTLDEIGKVLGLTRERVRQIETRALRRLKEPKTLLKFSKLR
jgi:RNA polymerase sigma factor (sigma-70 family)